MVDPSQPAVNGNELLERLGHNLQLLRKLCTVFEQNSPGWLRDLNAAILSANANSLRASAHTIKGALATLSALPAAELALSLEDLGKSGELASAPALVAAFTVELDRVREAFRTILAENAKTDLPENG